MAGTRQVTHPKFQLSIPPDRPGFRLSSRIQFSENVGLDSENDGIARFGEGRGGVGRVFIPTSHRNVCGWIPSTKYQAHRLTILAEIQSARALADHYLALTAKIARARLSPAASTSRSRPRLASTVLSVHAHCHLPYHYVGAMRTTREARRGESATPAPHFKYNRPSTGTDLCLVEISILASLLATRTVLVLAHMALASGMRPVIHSFNRASMYILTSPEDVGLVLADARSPHKTDRHAVKSSNRENIADDAAALGGDRRAVRVCRE
ncbi:hypothetical protein B0H12DRAFT_1071026 [Mycena haematopus]|nr:hypothetical protein B0H12DRAFT_1071026 [Mycena haematopus]